MFSIYSSMAHIRNTGLYIGLVNSHILHPFLCLGNVLEFWKTVKYMFSQFKESFIWLTGVGGRGMWLMSRRSSWGIKLWNGKGSLMPYFWKVLFKTNSLIKKNVLWYTFKKLWLIKHLNFNFMKKWNFLIYPNLHKRYSNWLHSNFWL